MLQLGEGLLPSPDWLCAMPPRPRIGKPCTTAATCGLDGQAAAATPGNSRQVVLDHPSAILVRMETCSPHCASRDCRWLASRRVQDVLEVDLAQTDTIRQETYTEGAPRTHLSPGCGEQHLGCTAYPRRAEDARIRNFRSELSCAGCERRPGMPSRRDVGQHS